jgi:hypothetical protein
MAFDMINIIRNNDSEEYNSRVSISFTRIKSFKGFYFVNVFRGDLVVLLDTNKDFKKMIDEKVGKGPYFVNEIYLRKRDACLEIQGSKGVGCSSAWHFQKYVE